MQKITPFLWFDADAEEAVNHYVSIFKDSRVVHVTRHGEHGPGPKGQAMVITFELAGQQFLALNGGPHFKFTEAISLVVNVETQAELDEMCARLASGGVLGRCGWLKDRYGLSWQVVPTHLGALLRRATAEQQGRILHAMSRMRTFDIAALEHAYAGEAA